MGTFTGKFAAADLAHNTVGVTLMGEVDTAFSRATATNIAGGIAGVTDVDNGIRVAREDLTYVCVPYYYSYGPYRGSAYDARPNKNRSDSHIANDIREELKWSAFVDAEKVEVRVEGGKAVPSGAVGTASERKAAT